MYQDIATRAFLSALTPDNQHVNQSSLLVPTQQGSRSERKRRAFEFPGFNIEPYHKKPKMVKETMSPVDDPKRLAVPLNLREARFNDFIWMCCLALKLPNTPMWCGFNATRTTDPLPIQRLCYLPQINMSPTSLSVVVQTMKMSQQLAEECDQKYISVTYDLAIAKLALCIQAEEAPKFDNIFIQLGHFHITMSFFKALGKFISDSGGPYVLTETGALAPGSLQGFLMGKHYNRCKRIHPIFSAALEILHFQEFIRSTDDSLVEMEVTSALKALKNEDFHQLNFIENISPTLIEIFKKYDSFCQETINGNHGPTAKFWMIYVQLVGVYHQLERAVRTGDHRLYIFLLPQIANMFFAFNHPNYARWLTKYHDNLLNMEASHPGITELFDNGAISIRRTKKNFSRSPIDITLEQTINADAASSSTGININYLI